MLRTTVSKFKKICAETIGSPIFNSKLGYGRLQKLSSKKKNHSSDHDESECEICKKLISYIFGEDSNKNIVLTDTKEIDAEIDAINTQNDNKRTGTPAAIVQSTTDKQSEEQLVQKLEVIEEPALVEAAKQNNEGFNVTPKVLGHTSVINFHDPIEVNARRELIRKDADQLIEAITRTQDVINNIIKRLNSKGPEERNKSHVYDDIATRCLSIPENQIDGYVLKEMEKLGGPQSTKKPIAIDGDEQRLQVGECSTNLQEVEELKEIEKIPVLQAAIPPYSLNLTPFIDTPEIPDDYAFRVERLIHDIYLKSIEDEETESYTQDKWNAVADATALEDEVRPTYDPSRPIIDPYDKKTLAYESKVEKIHEPLNIEQQIQRMVNDYGLKMTLLEKTADNLTNEIDKSQHNDVLSKENYPVLTYDEIKQRHEDLLAMQSEIIEQLLNESLKVKQTIELEEFRKQSYTPDAMNQNMDIEEHKNIINNINSEIETLIEKQNILLEKYKEIYQLDPSFAVRQDFENKLETRDSNENFENNNSSEEIYNFNPQATFDCDQQKHLLDHFTKNSDQKLLSNDPLYIELNELMASAEGRSECSRISYPGMAEKLEYLSGLNNANYNENENIQKPKSSEKINEETVTKDNMKESLEGNNNLEQLKSKYSAHYLVDANSGTKSDKTTDKRISNNILEKSENKKQIDKIVSLKTADMNVDVIRLNTEPNVDSVEITVETPAHENQEELTPHEEDEIEKNCAPLTQICLDTKDVSLSTLLSRVRLRYQAELIQEIQNNLKQLNASGKDCSPCPPAKKCPPDPPKCPPKNPCPPKPNPCEPKQKDPCPPKPKDPCAPKKKDPCTKCMKLDVRFLEDFINILLPNADGIFCKELEFCDHEVLEELLDRVELRSLCLSIEYPSVIDNEFAELLNFLREGIFPLWQKSPINGALESQSKYPKFSTFRDFLALLKLN